MLDPSDRSNRSRSWDAMKPPRKEQCGLNKPSALRAGLVAGGVAFSVSLVMSSIQRPVTELDFLDPRPGQVQADATAEKFSDQLRTDFAGVSRIAAVAQSLRAPRRRELSGTQDFLDFLEREFPEILELEISYFPRQDIPAPAAMVPVTVSTYPQPVPTGGGGGGEFPITETSPNPGLPPLLDIPRRVLKPVIASLPIPKFPTRANVAPPDVASPPPDDQSTQGESAAPSEGQSAVPSKGASSGTSGAGTDGGSSGTSGSGSGGTSPGGSGEPSGGGSGGGSSGSSGGDSGGDSGGGE